MSRYTDLICRGLLIATVFAVPWAHADTEPVPPKPARGFSGPTTYPSEALRRNERGKVEFELDIDVLGGVKSCRIIRTSGSSSLDNATCTWMSRQPFEPARDASGKAVPGVYSNSINWTIPRENVPPQPEEVIASYIVRKNGAMTDCKIEAVIGKSAEQIDQIRARVCTLGRFDQPYRDASGAPVDKRVTYTSRIEVTDVP